MGNPGFEISKDGSIPISIRIEGIETVRASLIQFFKDMQKLAKIDITVDTKQVKKMSAQVSAALSKANPVVNPQMQGQTSGKHAISFFDKTSRQQLNSYYKQARALYTNVASRQWPQGVPDNIKSAMDELQRVAKGVRDGWQVDPSVIKRQIDVVKKALNEESLAAKGAAASMQSLNKQRNQAYAKQAKFEYELPQKLQAYTDKQNDMSYQLQRMTRDTGVEQTTKEYQDFVALLERVRQSGGEGFDQLDRAAKRASVSITHLKQNLSDVAKSQAQQSVIPQKLQTYTDKQSDMSYQLQRMTKETGVEQTTKEYQDFVALLERVRQNGGQGFEQLDRAAKRASVSITHLKQDLADVAKNQARQSYTERQQIAEKKKEDAQLAKEQKQLQTYERMRTNMADSLRALSKKSGWTQTTDEFNRFSAELDRIKANGGKGIEAISQAAFEAQRSIKLLTQSLREEAQVQARLATVQEQYNTNYATVNDANWATLQRQKIASYSNGDPALAAQATQELNNVLRLGAGAKTVNADAQRELNAQMERYITTLGRLSNSSSANTTLMNQRKSLANLNSEIRSFMSASSSVLNKNPELSQRVQNLFEATNNQGNAGRVSELQAQWSEIRSACLSAGDASETTRSKMANLFSTHFNTAIIMAALNGLRIALRQLWQDIRDVNDALVQTQIVTGLAGASLENYTKKAYKAADSSRDTITNILESATAFGRLGYDADLSIELARLTSMYGKLGDVETEDATNAITALMKAFNLESADQIEAALDKLIYVGNNFPISAAGLGEGLNNAASSLAASGNTLEETLSLLMAANATVQNPSKASTAMRTITARIRNTKAELEELGEDVDNRWNTTPKYRAELFGLSGVDILDMNKEFRSTYDILKDLSDVWDDLGGGLDEQKTQIQSTITQMFAGTRNTDVFSSLMKNFPSAIEAMEGMDDATGLMGSKFEAVESSITGTLSRLSNAFSQFSNNLMNSEGVNKLIDMLTNLVNLLDFLHSKLGTVGSIGVIGLGAAFMKTSSVISQNLGQIQTYARQLENGQITNTIQELKNAPQWMQITVSNFAQLGSAERAFYNQAAQEAGVLTNWTSAGQMLGASLDGLQLKLQAFVASGNIWIMLAQAIVILISQISQSMKKAQAEARQAAAEARQTMVNQVQKATSASDSFFSSNKLDNYLSKLKDISKTLGTAESGSRQFLDAQSELTSINGKIVSQFGEEASVLSSINGDLDAYAQKLDLIAKRKRWDELNNDTEQAAGVRAMLSMFGIDKQGKALPTKGERLTIDTNISFKDTQGQLKMSETLLGGTQFTRTFGSAADYLNMLLGDELGSILGLANIHGTNDAAPSQYKQDTHGIIGEIQIADIHDTALAISLLTEKYKELDAAGDGGADTILAIVNAIKQSVGWSDVLKLFDEYISYMLLFDENAPSISEGYKQLNEQQAKFNSAVSDGDAEKASGIRDWILGEFDREIETLGADEGYKWMAQFMQAARDEFDIESKAMLDAMQTITPEETVFKPTHGRYKTYDKTKEQLKSTYDEDFSFIGKGNAEDAIAQVEKIKKVADPILEALQVFQRLTDYDIKKGEATNLRGIASRKDLDTIGGVLGINLARLDQNNLNEVAQQFTSLLTSTLFPLLEEAAIEAEKYISDTGSSATDFFKNNYSGNAARLAMWARDYGEKLPDTADAAAVLSFYDWLGKWYTLTGQTVAFNTANGTATFMSGKQPVQYVAGHGTPSSYESTYGILGNDTYSTTMDRMDSLWGQFSKFLKAKDVVKEMFDEEGTFLDTELTEEQIDAISDYFGEQWKKVTKENADEFKDVFEDAQTELYGHAESVVLDIINFLRDNGKDVGQYFDSEGFIDIAAVQGSLQELVNSGDTASANMAAAMINNLMALAGMKFQAVDNGDGVISVVASGGTDPQTAKTKRGGGGGGKKKKSKYEQDLDALERIIKMLREQLNYYEEGSDKWIARQRKIIDRYKAGVAITMQEYNRLIKSGLKQTDDSVKEIVDQILEYQDDIFKESQNLWEAVRQNQIDSLEHLKDQNDAAIKLENTHHDLLTTIRDERRELEDELKAARNAYSEVMTPAELDALFSIEDYTELMDKLTDIETDAMGMYAEYKEQIAAVSEDETYMVEYITDEFERQYELKMKEYEIAKAELGVARAQQELENVRNEQTVMMLKDGMWQWVADPEKVLEAERKLADAQQELYDAQDEFDFQSMVKSMEANSSELQRQIDALKALTFSMDELANQIHLFSDKVYKELLTYLTSSAQQYFRKYEGSTAVPAFASGGVIARSGLAEVHSGEPIFGTEDAVKLWKFVHNLTPNDISTAQTMAGINRMAVGNMNGTVATNANSMIDNSVTINGMRVDGENAQALIAIMRQVVASYQPITN